MRAFLTCFDPGWQSVLGRWDRACGVVGEATGWIVGFVEVDVEITLFIRSVNSDETSTFVGFPPVCHVPENYEESFTFRSTRNVETKLLGSDAEHNGSR